MEAPHQFTDPSKRGSGANLSGDALFALIGDDETIRAKVRLMVNMVLENAFQTLLHGTNQDRATLTRSMLPAITKAMTTQDDGGLAGLRNEMKAMFGKMMGDEEIENPPIPTAPPPPPPSLYPGT